MCLGLPMQIIEIDGVKAIAELNGVRREIRLDFVPKAVLNDYVMVHAGFALDLIREEEAIETAEVIREVIEASKR